MAVFVWRPVVAAADPTYVALDVPWWAWAALLGALAGLLAADLALHRTPHAPSPVRALVESLAWVSLGLGFAGVVGAAYGRAAAGEYVAGYLIEKSLSVDNVFVWSVIFAGFAIPLRLQHRVLFWGVFGALVLRGGFIAAGVGLLDRFSWLLVVFGVFLVFTGVKVVRHRADESARGADAGARWLRRFVPVTDELHGTHFLQRKGGRWIATPLLAALVAVELTDVVFAFDSVPAVLAVSREPFIVFSSNAFAVLGLRAAYFLLAGWRERLHYLGHGLGVLLVFVGGKMIASPWWHVPTAAALGGIALLLTVAVVASLARERRNVARPQMP